MDYQQAQAYLDQAMVFGIKKGLHRMNRLLDLLDNPQRRLRYIHVAGTNGKGSVSSYCASILACAGLKTGIYTSPYLMRLTDRIRIIDGRAGLERLRQDETSGEISEDAFAANLTRVKEAVDKLLAEGLEHPTEFELITATGFLHYSDSACDVVVLETGLGGRLDSTNVIENPLACIITALGYDHMAYLGDSIAEIAWEKAGIVKSGVPVYFYDPSASDLTAEEAATAHEVVRRRCGELGSPLQVVRRQDLHMQSYGWEGQSFTDRVNEITMRTSLLGVFQPMNAALAARTCLDLGLAEAGAVQDGIRLARWPGRLEILRKNPPILLDGCHNPQGVRALAAALDRLLPDRPVVFLAGMMRDKDVDTMLRAIFDHPRYQPAAFVCSAPEGARALPPTELAGKVREIAGQLPKPADSSYNVLDAIHAAATPAEAAGLALRLATSQGIALCAFGSLYLAGDVRRHLAVQEDRVWTGQG